MQRTTRRIRKLALSFDLLFRGLEITTGGQRIHDYQEQMDKLAARKMNAELFESLHHAAQSTACRRTAVWALVWSD